MQNKSRDISERLQEERIVRWIWFSEPSEAIGDRHVHFLSFPFFRLSELPNNSNYFTPYRYHWCILSYQIKVFLYLRLYSTTRTEIQDSIVFWEIRQSAKAPRRPERRWDVQQGECKAFARMSISIGEQKLREGQVALDNLPIFWWSQAEDLPICPIHNPMPLFFRDIRRLSQFQGFPGELPRKIVTLAKR